MLAAATIGEALTLRRALAWERTVSQQRYERIQHFEKLSGKFLRERDDARRETLRMAEKLNHAEIAFAIRVKELEDQLRERAG